MIYPTLYDTSSLSSCKGGTEDSIFGKFFVSSMEYCFLRKGLQQSDIPSATLYINVPV